MIPSFKNKRVEEERAAALDQLQAQQRPPNKDFGPERAGAVQLGSTVLGALVGLIASGGNPAGAMAGAALGGSLGSIAGVAINPTAAGAAGAVSGVEAGETAYDKLLKLLKQKKEINPNLPTPAAEEGLAPPGVAP